MNPSRMTHLVVAMMIMLVALLPAPLAARAQIVEPPSAAGIERGAAYVPGEVIVQFDAQLAPGEQSASAQALAGQVGAQVAAQMDEYTLLRFAEDADVSTAIRQVLDSGLVVSAQPNYLYWIPENGSEPRGGTLPAGDYRVQVQGGQPLSLTRAALSQLRSMVSGKATPTFPREFTAADYNTWGWDKANADIIWRNKNTSTAVCVLDSGVDGKHRDLSGRVVNGYDFINDDTIPEDDNGHGTHVGGIIAALNNNITGSALGVSNGKIVAVKVLNAQGWGTSMSVAAGVRYCAGRSDVRVINLSLGSAQKDPLEYDALRYAIVEKGKLVVTAAGNEYSSEPFYPAAWAADVETDPAGGANEIHIGLLAVAAARINPAIEPVWVDTSGDDIMQANEMYDAADCAAPFSNYGRYVSLVAPGHYIYSTTPTSYLFWGKYYYGDRSGYEFYSGTSMAAPYVAGAAVRTLSVYPQLTVGGDPNDSFKTWMIDNGVELNYAYDPAPGAGFDPANAWEHADYNWGQAVDGVARAPFCWSSAAGPYGAEQDMSGARYLNVAKAMGRFGLYTDVRNAATGLPLEGATVRLLRQTLFSTTIADTVKITRDSSAGIFLNIPYDPDALDVTYLIQVNRSGFTTGYQLFGGHWPDVDEQGDVWVTAYTTVAVPPAKDITVVVNWLPYQDANLDLYVWTPEDSVGKGVISAGWLGSYLPDYAEALTGVKDWLQGTLLAPEKFNGMVSPYAQLRHDGGRYGFASSILAFDAVTIKSQPGSALRAWYTDPAITDSYHVLVTDYSNAYPGAETENFDYRKLLNYSDPYTTLYPVLRVWGRGRLLNIVDPLNRYWYGINPYPDGVNCGNAAIDWWHAVDIKGSVVTPVNQCGTSTPSGGSFEILPYP